LQKASPAHNSLRWAGLLGLGWLSMGSFLAAEAVVNMHATVVAVVDGDTLVVQDARGNRHTVSLAGIDAPEKMQVFGRKAKFILSDLTYLKVARLALRAPDAQGRQRAQVWVGRQDVALAQLERGMAWADPESVLGAKVQAGYRAAQVTAQRQKVGLWSQAQAVAPWAWRAQPTLLR
jgi:micrococcal nuclease